MKAEYYIEQLKPIVIKYFDDDRSGHDDEHLTRTMQIALHICKKEKKGNEVIIAIAAYLHDVHRLMQTKLKRYVSPLESLPEVEKILENIDISLEMKKQILYCIEHHEVYNWNDPENKNRPVEVLIVQDADNLDALGAVGASRSICYSHVNHIPWYDPTIPYNTNSNYAEENGFGPSSLHHFHHKLFKLSDHMNTKTGTKLAKQRIKFMKKFEKQLIAEIEGIC